MRTGYAVILGDMKLGTNSEVGQKASAVRISSWVALVVGLVWLGYVFVKYNDGPFVPFWEAAFDCLPLLITAGATVALVRTSPAMEEDCDASESQAAVDTAAFSASDSLPARADLKRQTPSRAAPRGKRRARR